MLQLDYLAVEAAAGRLENAPQFALGVLGFPELPAISTRTVPGAGVGMFVANSDVHLCELWTSSEPVVHGSRGRIRHSACGELLFGIVSSPESEGSVEARSRLLYEEIFTLLQGDSHHHVLRFWNYISDINGDEAGTERYRLFNVGRHAAFEAAGRLRPETIPAASALGTQAGGDLTVCFLASREPGRQIENPRQVHAWQYPKEYGARSPTFSRALTYPFDDPSLLFVSGTASIVGHQTRHAGDVAAQVRETMANLGSIFTEASGFGDFRLANAKLKAYVRDPAYAPAVEQGVSEVLGKDARVICLVSDICRADLLVEIEAFCPLLK